MPTLQDSDSEHDKENPCEESDESSDEEYEIEYEIQNVSNGREPSRIPNFKSEGASRVQMWKMSNNHLKDLFLL